MGLVAMSGIAAGEGEVIGYQGSPFIAGFINFQVILYETFYIYRNNDRPGDPSDLGGCGPGPNIAIAG
jgi:hypothetical protein